MSFELGPESDFFGENFENRTEIANCKTEVIRTFFRLFFETSIGFYRVYTCITYTFTYVDYKNIQTTRLWKWTTSVQSLRLGQVPWTTYGKLANSLQAQKVYPFSRRLSRVCPFLKSTYVKMYVMHLHIRWKPMMFDQYQKSKFHAIVGPTSETATSPRNCKMTTSRPRGTLGIRL